MENQSNKTTGGVGKTFQDLTDKVKDMLSTEKPDLHDLFVMELKDLYWAEKALVEALPEMASKATTAELELGLLNHLEETKIHVTRLEDVFRTIGEEPMSEKCEAMDGLVTEAEQLMDETEDGTLLRDVAIISAAQKVEHYEIASYGTLKTLASVLGYMPAVELLSETLNEEKNADSLLTQIAESFVNQEAMQE